MTNLLLGLINGVALGSVLFIVSAGFTFTFGVMRILNLAHGALYMVGGYVGWTVAVEHHLSFGLALFAGGAAAATVGVVLERGFLRHVGKDFNDQAVLTYGFLLIITNIVLWVWGPSAKTSYEPGFLSHSINWGDVTFPVGRLGLIALAVLLAVALWVGDRKTLVGARVRAGRDDAMMLEALGIDFGKMTALLFAFGAFLAGFASVAGAQIMGVNLQLSTSIVLTAIVVVVIGGLGSVGGALIGAMIIGCTQSLGTIYFPSIASFTLYFVMVIILTLRPTGLAKVSI